MLLVKADELWIPILSICGVKLMCLFHSFFNFSGYDNDEKEKSSALQSNRREHVLVMRLASKEQEVQECIVCV